ncbi:MAG: serine/threonine-protein phosphatase [Deltaproteobacteria bacterium]|nr:serine/threonine-protein phosphatase [Deltaproteobacteria bacterium]
MELKSYGLTDQGDRPNNEDTFLTNDRLGAYLLCDGMGGPAGGDFASFFASRQVMDTLVKASEMQISKKKISGEETLDPYPDDAKQDTPESYLEYAVWQTNQQFHRVAAKKANDGQKMGTTLVGFWFLKDKIWSLNVGDSRAYGLWDNHLFRLTRDDCWVEEQILMGQIDPEEAHRYRSKITKAVGTNPYVNPQINSHPIPYSGGRFLLCSDGFYDHVPSDEIAKLMPLSNLEEAAKKMIEKAVELGKAKQAEKKVKVRDNITVLVIDLKMYGIARPEEDTLNFE